jgi:hypothetical protein
LQLCDIVRIKMAGTFRGFLLTSVVALSIALTASAAHAESTFKAPVGSELEGQRAGSDEFVTGGIDVACGELTFTGELSGKSAILEVEPEFSECRARALSGLPADFFQELCDFRLHDLEGTGSERWRAAVGIKCHGGYYAIGWDIYETEEQHLVADQLCSTRVLQRPDAGTAEVRNLGGQRSGIEIRWNLDNLRYEIFTQRDQSSSLFCGSTLGKTRSDAYYKGVATIVGKDSAGRPAQLSVSG